jgi:hypothetical protein
MAQRLAALVVAVLCVATPTTAVPAVRPPGPYSAQLVPPVILFPEPLHLEHGDTIAMGGIKVIKRRPPSARAQSQL